jgi:hypothetical protein
VIIRDKDEGVEDDSQFSCLPARGGNFDNPSSVYAKGIACLLLREKAVWEDGISAHPEGDIPDYTIKTLPVVRLLFHIYDSQAIEYVAS